MEDDKKIPESIEPAERVAIRTSARAPEAVVVRRRGGGLAILLALIALGLAGWTAWRGYEAERTLAALSSSDSGDKVAAIARSSEQAQRDVASIRTRLADSDRVNQSVRDELLGIQERSRNIENAVANLAEQHNSGSDVLAVNEAEMLLLIGQQKLELFHDPAAALSAYRLADSSLAAANDPVFLSLRQTIGAEMKALESAPSLSLQPTLDALERVRTGVAAWPAKSMLPQTETTPASESRIAAWFGKFIRVSHEGTVGGENRSIDLARLLAEIDLRSAEAALLARDPQAFTAALGRVKSDIDGVVDSDATSVKDALAELDRLAQTPLAPKLPQLGSALSELRNLRASRALSRSPPVTPPSAQHVEVPAAGAGAP